jgi:hypothetical protein
MHLGPQDVLATVRIDFDDTVSAARVETIVGDLEGAIKARFPEIRHLFLSAKGIESTRDECALRWSHGVAASSRGVS